MGVESLAQPQDPNWARLEPCDKKDLTAYEPDWLEFMAGGGAAFINIISTFPLNKLIFRQQIFGISVRKAFKQVKHEGAMHLYRGVLPPLMMKTCSVSLMFGLYDQYSRILLSNYSSVPVPVIYGVAAVLSGSTEAVLTPFERVQTILQDQRRQKKYTNTFHVFKSLRIYGFKEYYRGFSAIILRNGPSNAVFFGLRGEVRTLLPEAKTYSGNIMKDFFSGAIVGAMISTLWYPVNVVKSRMQSKVGGKFRSFSYVFMQIYNERGRHVRGMFYGVHLNFSRALISWGIINASYEVLKSILGGQR